MSILQAVKDDNVEAILEALKGPGDINGADPKGWTAEDEHQ